jgi:hypothetical protein
MPKPRLRCALALNSGQRADRAAATVFADSLNEIGPTGPTGEAYKIIQQKRC